MPEDLDSATVSPARTTSAPPWTPTFPAQSPTPHDPNDPSTWIPTTPCTGFDRHAVSVTPRQTAITGITGAVWTAFDVYFRVPSKALGVGIGLLLVPLIAVLFARWVDGPVLYYRNGGRVRQLRLHTVTKVTTGRRGIGSASVRLSAPGLREPLTISLRSKGYVMAPAARDHLRCWMNAPSVQWSPAAAALFDEHTAPVTAPTRRRHQALATLLSVVIPLAALGGRIAIGYEHRAALAIPGAPGYFRFGGSHGKLLAVGRPWGSACQPIRFAVEPNTPDDVYSDFASVVAEARSDGLDVTLDNRQLTWTPQALYYPPGQSSASVRRVLIDWETGPPRRLGNGTSERLKLGWNTAVDADGDHEDITSAQGQLWSRSLANQPQAVRRSIRQLIAMTQGVMRTSRADSGIAQDTGNDRFSTADVAAMKLMSGCGDLAPPTG